MTAALEYAAAADALRGLHRLKSLGYLNVETHGPFPLSDEDAHAPRGSVVLSFLAVAGGVVALVAAYLVQWYANVVAYPLNIGGRPAHAAPAFIPATFESICLFATAALCLGFVLLERLPRLSQPIFEIEGFERASIDRFWIVVRLPDAASGERLAADAAETGPTRILVEDGQ